MTLDTQQDPKFDRAAERAPDSGCHDVHDLLPWLLNGSLNTEERDWCTQHLASCEACRVEFEAMAKVWDLVTIHVSSGDLAAYSLGLGTTEWGRGQIESHLAACSACSSEVAGIQTLEESRISRQIEEIEDLPGTVVGFPMERPKRAMSLWGVAAGLILTATLGFLSGSGLDVGTASHQSTAAQSEEAPTAQSGSHGVVLRSDGFETGSIGGWSLVNSELPQVQKHPSSGAPSSASDDRS